MIISADKTQHEPTEFAIYGFVITTSTSCLLQKLFRNKAARKRGVIIHDTKPSILAGYIHWLQTRKFWAQKCDESMTYAELIDYFFLGELVEDPNFCEVIVDAIIAMRYEVEEFNGKPTRPLPGAAVMNKVWEQASLDSPIRKVMTELWMSALVTKAMKFLTSAGEPGYPKELILALLAEIVERGDFEDENFSKKNRKDVEESCRGYLRGVILGSGSEK